MKYFISCNNPVSVNTRKGPIFVACHKCIQCQLTRKSIDTLAIDLESQYNSKYQDFLTLTYDDSNLPYLDFNYLTCCSSDEGNFISSVSVLNSYSFDYNDKNQMPCVPIRFGNRKKRMFNPKTGKYSLVVDKYYQKAFYSPYYSTFSVKDVILYNERIDEYFEKYPSRSRGIRKIGIVPILWKEDLQRFIDRLRSYFKRSFGEKAKFRYFAVGEYGTNSLRPHWHILLFHNSDSIRKVIADCTDGNYNKILSKIWLYGNLYTETTDGHISDYLSGYVNCYSNLPEILSPYPQKNIKAYYLERSVRSRLLRLVSKKNDLESCQQLALLVEKELKAIFPFPLRLSVDYSLDSRVMIQKILKQFITISPALIRYYNR